MVAKGEGKGVGCTESLGLIDANMAFGVDSIAQGTTSGHWRIM